jgi:hypothetical protein
MRHLLALATLAALTAACDSAPTAPATSAGTGFAAGGNSQKVPFQQINFVPCANGGAGERVRISGTLNIVLVDKTNANGHSVFHLGDSPQGATGVGLTTGTVYHATGITLETATGNADTYVNNFRLIGPGRAANFLVHDVFHITVNARGVVSVDFQKSSVECKQG